MMGLTVLVIAVSPEMASTVSILTNVLLAQITVMQTPPAPTLPAALAVLAMLVTLATVSPVLMSMNAH